MYKLHTDIPLPPRRNAQPKPARVEKYPFRKMAIGMSFFVPKKETNGDIDKLVVRISAAAYAATKALGIKLAVRRMPEGVGVWRVQ